MNLWQGQAIYSCIIVTLTSLLFACQPSTKPVIKIGMIAPFEGTLSHVGYQRLYGVKLALQEMNQQGGIAGYKVELVALNDFGDKQEAQSQIQELVIDTDVKAAVGQWDSEMFAASVEIYDTVQLAVVEPSQFTDLSSLSDTFDETFQKLSHTPSTPESKQAYLATTHLLQTIEQAIQQHGGPSRANIWHVFTNATVFSHH